MKKILIIFCHPAFEKSVVHKSLLRKARAKSHVEIHDLYEKYPNFLIDVKHEQEKLLGADIIIFQHPIFWYSSPALLKEWLDLVLEPGFAFAKGGDSLKGKKLLSVVSTGASCKAYGPEGMNRFTINQFLAPFDQTANLCGMEYLPPFVVFGSHNIRNILLENKTCPELDAQAEEFSEILDIIVKEDFSATSHPISNTINEICTGHKIAR